MKRTTLTIAAAALLISTSAFAQSVGEKTGVNSTLGISPTTADFVKEAAMSDMTEIAASKLGQERGNAQQKTFASQMITDQDIGGAKVYGACRCKGGDTHLS
jgi:putative membrane protein